MIHNLEQAPQSLQVIIKVPAYNNDGRRYYTNMDVSKDKVLKIIKLIDGKKDEVKTLKEDEKVSVKPNKKSPKKTDKKPQNVDKQIKSED